MSSLRPSTAPVGVGQRRRKSAYTTTGKKKVRIRKNELDELKRKYDTQFQKGSQQFLYGVRLEQSGE